MIEYVSYCPLYLETFSCILLNAGSLCHVQHPPCHTPMKWVLVINLRDYLRYPAPLPHFPSSQTVLQLHNVRLPEFAVFTYLYKLVDLISGIFDTYVKRIMLGPSAPPYIPCTSFLLGYMTCYLPSLSVTIPVTPYARPSYSTDLYLSPVTTVTHCHFLFGLFTLASILRSLLVLPVNYL